MTERDALADILRRLFPPPASYEEWQAAVDRSYEADADALIAAGVHIDPRAMLRAALADEEGVKALAEAIAIVHETDPAWVTRPTHSREEAAEHWREWRLDAEAIAAVVREKP